MSLLCLCIRAWSDNIFFGPVVGKKLEKVIASQAFFSSSSTYLKHKLFSVTISRWESNPCSEQDILCLFLVEKFAVSASQQISKVKRPYHAMPCHFRVVYKQDYIFSICININERGKAKSNDSKRNRLTFGTIKLYQIDHLLHLVMWRIKSNFI